FEHDGVVVLHPLDPHRVRRVDELPRQVLEQLLAQFRARPRAQPRFCVLSRRRTDSVGVAPLPSQSRTLPSSNSISDGSSGGLYRPTMSMNLPSRGERESATTTR